MNCGGVGHDRLPGRHVDAAHLRFAQYAATCRPSVNARKLLMNVPTVPSSRISLCSVLPLRLRVPREARAAHRTRAQQELEARVLHLADVRDAADAKPDDGAVGTATIRSVALLVEVGELEAEAIVEETRRRIPPRTPCRALASDPELPGSPGVHAQLARRRLSLMNLAARVGLRGARRRRPTRRAVRRAEPQRRHERWTGPSRTAPPRSRTTHRTSADRTCRRRIRTPNCDRRAARPAGRDDP